MLLSAAEDFGLEEHANVCICWRFADKRPFRDDKRLFLEAPEN